MSKAPIFSPSVEEGGRSLGAGYMRDPKTRGEIALQDLEARGCLVPLVIRE